MKKLKWDFDGHCHPPPPREKKKKKKSNLPTILYMAVEWIMDLTSISVLFLAGRCLEGFQSALEGLVLKTVVFVT